MVSQNVLAALVGSYQQDVSRCMDILEWLGSKIRKAAFPPKQEGPIPRSIYAGAKAEAFLWVNDAENRLRDNLPEAKEGGRPVKRDPKELAEFLGVPCEEEDTLATVFAKFVEWFMGQLDPMLFMGLKSFSHLWKMLDAHWVTLSPRSVPIYDEESELELAT